MTEPLRWKRLFAAPLSPEFFAVDASFSTCGGTDIETGIDDPRDVGEFILSREKLVEARRLS